MSDERTDWTPETVPDTFWNRIEAAGGSVDRFTELIGDIPEPELRDMYWQYYSLAEWLLSEEHISHMSNSSDDAIMDLANWIVSQGRKVYFDVYQHPERTPPEVPERGMSFLSAILLTYSDRFGKDLT